MKTSTEFLLAAAENQAQRAALRDAPDGERSMAKAVEMFNILYDTNLTEAQGWDFMSLLKKVRGSQGEYHEDDYLDDVSYSSLKAEAASRENEPWDNVQTGSQCPCVMCTDRRTNNQDGLGTQEPTNAYEAEFQAKAEKAVVDQLIASEKARATGFNPVFIEKYGIKPIILSGEEATPLLKALGII